MNIKFDNSDVNKLMNFNEMGDMNLLSLINLVVIFTDAIFLFKISHNIKSTVFRLF